MGLGGPMDAWLGMGVFDDWPLPLTKQLIIALMIHIIRIETCHYTHTFIRFISQGQLRAVDKLLGVINNK